MGSDLYALSAIANELNCRLSGGRIDKIQQPEEDELRFFVRVNGRTECLVMSCNAQAPRIHITDSKKQSPKNAPNLCMLLRKYLSVASVAGVGVFNRDRIIYVKFKARSEMGDENEFFMFAEIMNRYSNLVFTDGDLIILDAVKHLPLDIARDHIVMRGVKYAPVGQSKISYLSDCIDVFRKFPGGDLHKYVLSNISGFSGATVTELLYRANIEEDCPALSEEQLTAIEKTIDLMRGTCGPQYRVGDIKHKNKETDDLKGYNKNQIEQNNENVDFCPCVINGEVYPSVYCSLLTLGKDNIQYFESMSAACDAVYTNVDKDIRNKSRLKTLAGQAKRLVAKVEKNIAQDIEKLAECENMETLRVFGELIVNNIYLIKKGDRTLKCLNYYDGNTVEIPLDVTLSPSKNSAAYYAKYNKLKRAKEFVTKKLEDDRELLSYARSIEEEIAALPYGSDSRPIEEELNMLGGGKKKASKGKIRKEAPEPPFTYLVDGFYIYKGKNNMQNDELTFKIASSNDIWLHLKADHGAHTVIITDSRPVPDKVLNIAAEIAASSKSASADVDYTTRRNVKRKPSGHPGQVIYVNYKTLRAKPDAHTEFLLK